MSDAMPCPCCGSDYVFGEGACRVCGFRLGDPHASNVGTGRCARCGSQMPEQFDFCPVCGLDQRRRFRRPSTDTFGVHARRRTPPPGAVAPPPAAAHAFAANTPPGPQSAPVPAPAAMGGFVPVGTSSSSAAAAPAAPQPAVAPQPAAPAPAPVAPAPVAPQPAAPAPAAAAPAPAAGPAFGGFEPVGQRASAAWPPARLVLVRRDGTDGQAFPFQGSTFELGRESGDATFPHDTFLSPVHARIERTADEITLVDLGSRNGAYLRVRGPEAVYPGDLFLIGHQLLRLENLDDGEQEREADAQGTRAFGSPVERAWGKVQLIGGGGAYGDTFYLRGTDVVFGRELGDVIFPHDGFLSRRHACLRMQMTGQGMVVLLEDLGSANGCYLRIRGRAPLQAGDMFRIGDQILRLQVG